MAWLEISPSLVYCGEMQGLAIFALALIGCGPNVVVHGGGDGTPMDGGDRDWSSLEDVSMMSCVAVGWEDWGANLTNCKLKLWFAVETSPPDREEEEEDETNPWGWPLEMGVVALYVDFNVFWDDEDDEEDEEDEEDEPGEPGEGQGGGGGGGGGNASIHLDAGPQLELATEYGLLPLTYAAAGTGGYEYQYWDCGPETFPFGEEMDLSVPGGSEGLAVGAFSVESALAFGPALRWVTPEAGTAVDPTAPLDLAWTFDGPSVDVEGAYSGAQLEILAEKDGEPLARVAARPEDGLNGITIPAEMVEVLFDDPDAEVHLRLSINHDGPKFELPWGRNSSVRLSMSMNGALTPLR